MAQLIFLATISFTIATSMIRFGGMKDALYLVDQNIAGEGTLLRHR